MFDNMLGGGKEAKAELLSEQRQNKFNRDQATLDMANQEDGLTLQRQEDRSDLLRWQQDLLDELQMLKHDLRSEVITEEGIQRKQGFLGYGGDGKPVYGDLPPLMNDIGIQMVESISRPLLSRNMLNSNFNEDRILQILLVTSNDIVDNIADNYDVYGIDFVNFDVITRLIKNVMIPTMFRALNDGERKHARTISKRIEAFNEQTKSTDNKSRWALFN